MISWMQRHNKYLVVTIWVAVIAFIGAGAVSWGNMNLSSRASSVAKVGDVQISKIKYAFTYDQVYSQYAQKLGNKFDKNVAKKLGLEKNVLKTLIQQALLLNLANEYGIIATDKEVGLEIVSVPLFKNSKGEFDKSIYDNFLKSRGLRAQDFEAILKDEIKIRKLTKLLNIKPLDFEKEVLESTFSIADKIKYKLLKFSDINVTVNDDELKKYWQKNKMNYLTKQKYVLKILWTTADDINATDSDLEKFYKQNSFNYIDSDGKIKKFEDVKNEVLKDYKLKKIKKLAAIERSRFKKGKIRESEQVTLSENDTKLSKEIWQALKSAKVGDFLKPKIVDNKFATVHLVKIVKPQVMSFNEAKELVKKDFINSKKRAKIDELSKKLLTKVDEFNLEPKDYISLSKFQILPNLTPQDSLKVIRHIFNSSKKVDKVAINEGVVVYKIVDQKLLDNNSTSSSLDKEVKNIKNSELLDNLITQLYKKYSVQSYIKDLK